MEKNLGQDLVKMAKMRKAVKMAKMGKALETCSYCHVEYTEEHNHGAACKHVTLGPNRLCVRCAFSPAVCRCGVVLTEHRANG